MTAAPDTSRPGSRGESADADHFTSTVFVWEAGRPANTGVRVDVDGTAVHGGIDDFVLNPRGSRLYVAGRERGLAAGLRRGDR